MLTNVGICRHNFFLSYSTPLKLEHESHQFQYFSLWRFLFKWITPLQSTNIKNRQLQLSGQSQKHLHKGTNTNNQNTKQLLRLHIHLQRWNWQGKITEQLIGLNSLSKAMLARKSWNSKWTSIKKEKKTTKKEHKCRSFNF